MGWGFIWNLFAKKKEEPKPTAPPEPVKSIPMTIPTIKKIPLDKGQYRTDKQNKTHIFLHHTAGGSVAGAIAGWNSTPERVATPYIIERTGDIYEVYDPELWANHLGGKCPLWLEKASIGIEIVCYGQLTKKINGDLTTYTGRTIKPEDAVKADFRGYEYYQRYTPEQISALKQLLPYLVDKFKIKLQEDRKNFWEYQDPSKLPPGIWSHTTVRKDKVDIFPQKEIVDLVYSI